MPKTFSPDTGSTLTTSLNSYWTLEGNSNDQQGTDNGTDTSITYSTGNGKIDQGAGFNGSSSQIVIADSANLRPSPNLSVALWYNNTTNPASNAYYSMLWKNATNATREAYSLQLFNDAGTVKIRANFNNANTGAITYAFSGTGSWKFLVATYDGDAMKLYVDNVLQASNTGGAAISYENNLSLYFGSTDFAGRFFDGAIDEVGLWSKVLTTTEISDLWNGGSGNTYKTRVTSQFLLMGA